MGLQHRHILWGSLSSSPSFCFPSCLYFSAYRLACSPALHLKNLQKRFLTKHCPGWMGAEGRGEVLQKRLGKTCCYAQTFLLCHLESVLQSCITRQYMLQTMESLPMKYFLQEQAEPQAHSATPSTSKQTEHRVTTSNPA